MEIIIGRQGNQKKNITEPTVSRKHCRVTVTPEGAITIENLSDYGTKVDGVNIIKTTATLESEIELGPVFKASLREIIGDVGTNGSTLKASGDNKKDETQTFNISHLKHIWENFNTTNIENAEKQRKINLTRTGLGIFTMCAMPTCFFLGPIGYAITAVGVIGNLYSFVGMKNSESIIDRQKRQDAFDEAWVCPNPECNRTLPAKNYKMLVRNLPSCPYCKAKYIEK